MQSSLVVVLLLGVPIITLTYVLEKGNREVSPLSLRYYLIKFHSACCTLCENHLYEPSTEDDFIFSFFLQSMTQLIVVSISVAWLIGWALILEYTLGSAAVARGISPNLVQ